MEFGDKLQKLRISKRISQSEMAILVGVAKSTYNSWENNRTFPSARRFPLLVNVLGVSASELVDPNWTVTVSKPPTDDESMEVTIFEANAFKMLEALFQDQLNLQKRLEKKLSDFEVTISLLENKISTLEKRL